MTNFGSSAMTFPSAIMSRLRGAITGSSLISMPTPWPINPACWRCPMKYSCNPSSFTIFIACSYRVLAAVPGRIISISSRCMRNEQSWAFCAGWSIPSSANTRVISVIYPVKLPFMSTMTVLRGLISVPLAPTGSEGSSPAPPIAKS